MGAVQGWQSIYIGIVLKNPAGTLFFIASSGIASFVWQSHILS